MPQRPARGSNQHQTKWQTTFDRTQESGITLSTPFEGIHSEPILWAADRPLHELDEFEREMVGQPYQAAVVPPIENVRWDLDSDAQARSENARAAIVRLDAELATMFDGVLDEGQEFAPLPGILLRAESLSSSQVEGIHATAEELALAELGYDTTVAAAEVAANVAAMNRALIAGVEVDTASILHIHETLMAGRTYATPGQFRDVQVWINGDPGFPHDAEFIPPAHARVPAAIEDLSRFARRPDVPLFTRAAIAHAQFETIHPFRDGNGRVGRALIHSILRRGGATSRLAVPVSSALVQDIDGYINDLTAYRNGDASPIVRRFSNAATQGVTEGRRLAQDMVEVHRGWVTRLSSRKGSAAARALPYLLSQPVVSGAWLAEILKVSRRAGDMAIASLANDGIVTQAGGGERNRVWVAHDVTTTLDAFAGRTRSRPARSRPAWLSATGLTTSARA